MNNKEYLVFGFTIEKLCLLYGVILVMFGIAISFASSSASLTSYIPSFLGIPLIISSYLSIIDSNRKKLYAHISVFIILIAYQINCRGGSRSPRPQPSLAQPRKINYVKMILF